jgi:hypothetical protein
MRTVLDIAGHKQAGSRFYSPRLQVSQMAVKTNKMSVVFHGFLAPRLKLRQFVSLEIILRGFLVDALRCCSQLAWFFHSRLKILSHAIS